jgi:hypothetical protein
MTAAQEFQKVVRGNESEGLREDDEIGTIICTMAIII